MGKYISPAQSIQLWNCVRELNSGSVSEEILRSLFMHIREYAKFDSLTREIGDFFAHPERRQGIAHSLVENNFAEFERQRRGETKKGSTAPVDYISIVDDVNAVLRKLDIDEISERSRLDFALTLFLALQGMRVQLRKEAVLPLSFLSDRDIFAVLCPIILLRRGFLRPIRTIARGL